jgi:hypothetical protein
MACENLCPCLIPKALEFRRYIAISPSLSADRNIIVNLPTEFVHFNVNILKVFEFVKSITGLNGDVEVAELSVYGAYPRSDVC